ncbi:MAG: ankyrin repeat domain-containing protein [Planctomycetota bacterium]
MFLAPSDPLALALVDALHAGQVAALQRLLAERPGLGAARIGDAAESSPLLCVLADWPGNRPRGDESVRALVAAGADPNGRGHGPRHQETALHWAASSDDLPVLGALLDAGADLEAAGAVIAGGTPLDDAVAFAQWRAARRLVERGARVALWHAAALGLLDRVRGHLDGAAPLPAAHPWGGDARPRELDVALWCAAHGDQRAAAELLLAHGADPRWRSPWDGLSPAATARRQGAVELATWLEARAGASAGG